MAKQLTESQAWREIARRLEDPSREVSGICHEIDRLQEEGKVPADAPFHMRKKVYEVRDAQRPPCGCGDPDCIARPLAEAYLEAPGVRPNRVLLALLFAAEAADDERAQRRAARAEGW